MRRSHKLIQRGTDIEESLSGITIGWSRYLRIVGEVSPNAALSDFTDEWTADGAGFNAIAPVGPTAIQEMKMQPLRYEIGVYGDGLYPERVSTSQEAIGPRSTAAPTTGHLRSTTATTITLGNTVVIYGGETFGLNAALSVIRAVEVFRNDESVGLYNFGDSHSLAVRSSPGVFTHLPILITLSSPVELRPVDTLAFDYYVVMKSNATGALMHPALGSWVAGTAVPGTQSYPPGGTVRVTGSDSRVSDIGLYKVTFADNGPGGVTELELKSQAGWTAVLRTAFAITLAKNDGSYIVAFQWKQEIPYVEIFIPSLVTSFASRCRYHPSATGDYSAIAIGSQSIEYGVWKPSAVTSFANKVIMPNGIAPARWYSTLQLPPSYFASFPSSVSVERS
ncbi:MAG TPA: hypothetical protein PLY87_26840 [Planctomycetaceae bacterium]|nr:hypothetical protein [Planctomycetaceae bacterium]